MSAPSVDAVVVGSGMAGLSAALELAHGGLRVEVVTPGRAGCDGSTHRVHALAPWVLLTAPRARGDSPAEFFADLVARGDGEVREAPARAFADGAHRAAEEVCDLLGLEPIEASGVVLTGDKHPRGLRCRPRRPGPMLGDLVRRCQEAGVEFREGTLAVGLGLTADGAVCSVAVHERDGRFFSEIFCRAVVLACGGSAGVFPTATAPRWCRGSALALGAAAGALLHVPHRLQALPVTLPPLMCFPGSAALLHGRLEVDGLPVASPDELDAFTRLVARAAAAGRTVELVGWDEGVARAAARAAGWSGDRRVALTVAAHHGIGGVAIDAWGRTSLAGLYACGEAAGGIQGRRRTMGTGLVEARVFGVRAGRAVLHDAARLHGAGRSARRALCTVPARPEALEERLDVLMGSLVVERPPERVARARAELAAWPAACGGDRKGWLAALRWRAAEVILEAELDARPGKTAASYGV